MTPESAIAHPQLRIGPHLLDLERGLLLDAGGQPIALRPQAWQVLHTLALQAGGVVSRDALLAAVWPGLVVTDDSLVQAIGDVRRALGPGSQAWLQTVPRRGYRLVAEAAGGANVAQSAEVTADPAGAAPPHVLRIRSVALMALLAVLVLVLAASMALLRPWAQPEAAARTGVSIAVLPFRDAQGGATDDPLGRSLAQDLVSELARAPDLRVVSHQSSFQFDLRRSPLAQISAALQVRYVVDGTVRRHSEQLHIALELLDAKDGRVLWSDRRQVPAAGLFAAQQDLVGRIAGSLQMRMRDSEQRRAMAQPPASLDAVALTQRGKTAMETYSPAGIREARLLLEQAVALEPRYAVAWVYLGITNTIDIGSRVTGEWGMGRIDEVLAQIESAVALERELPVAYVALSQAQALARRFEAALASAQRCAQLSPNDADCFYILGKTQMHLGQPVPAIHNLEQALERNPMPPAYLPAFYATALWAGGRPADALRAADDCLQRAPDFWLCRQDRLAALVDLGRLDAARQEATVLMARRPDMRAEGFASVFADTATVLRARRVAAAQAAGLP